MDRWQSTSVRAERGDVVLRWATLEGKSPSMSEDLYRRYAVARNDRAPILAVIGVLAKLYALMLHAWRLTDGL